MFKGKLDLRAYVPEEWVMLALLMFYSAAGVVYAIPRGFITDLASIPRLLRWMFSVNGISREPAVLHDFLYSTQPCTRAEADALFLEALKAVGASAVECRALYWGVRMGGWVAWGGHKKDTHLDNFVPDSYWDN
jgi:hypothetical protein